MNHTVYIFPLETRNISRQQEYGAADICYFFNKAILQVRVCNLCKMLTIKNLAGGDWEGKKKSEYAIQHARTKGKAKKKTVQDYFVSLFQNALSTLINK